MNRYQVLLLEEAAKRGFEEAGDYFDGDMRSGLFECDDQGNLVRLVFTDGGEPEDATLSRDLSVFVDELNTLVARLEGNAQEEE